MTLQDLLPRIRSRALAADRAKITTAFRLLEPILSDEIKQKPSGLFLREEEVSILTALQHLALMIAKEREGEAEKSATAAVEAALAKTLQELGG